MPKPTSTNANLPVPRESPLERTMWGETVVDPYDWLSDPKDSKVLAHLADENAASDAWFDEIQALQDDIFGEIKSRIKETDLSVPIEKDGWAYYGRTEEGCQYGIHCRRRTQPSDSNPEQILLDENTAAGSDDYFDLGVFDVSPDHRLLLWGSDRSGSEQYELKVRDLETGQDLADEINDCSAGSAWASDSKSFCYVRMDESQRPFQIWHHTLGDGVDNDRLVFEELDERFFVGVGLERDEQYIQIGLSSAITDETWLIPAAAPETKARCVQARETGVEYALAHRDKWFVVLTNYEASNFRLMITPDHHTGRDNWVELIPHRPDVMIAGFEVFDKHLVLFERVGGQAQMSVADWDTQNSDTSNAPPTLGPLRTIDQPEEVYSVWSGANVEADASVLRYGYSSMVTPPSVFTVDLETGERDLLKQIEVLGDFDSADYLTWREWAPAPDGTKIPISLVKARNRSAEPGPAVLYGYGAYEATIDPVFSSARLSLLDRGFVFAVAHVRGGGAMGRAWYEDGKFEHKTNTFSDMLACAHHLISIGLTTEAELGLRGGSAGGLMVGAVLNMAPQQFGAAVAEVPFVDVLNTMSKPELPLTVTEWEEWGNPVESEAIYRTMRGYSPVENVVPASYPAILATAGLNDPRVGYWEPAKWVATIRRHTTSDNPVLLRTEMGAGHGGSSGRYSAWKDEARVLAFLIAILR